MTTLPLDYAAEDGPSIRRGLAGKLGRFGTRQRNRRDEVTRRRL